MKKIAFITPHYLPSNLTGSGVFVAELAKAFANRGDDVTVVTSNALTVRYWYDPIFGKKIVDSFEVLNKVKVVRLKCNQVVSSLVFILVSYFARFLPKDLFNRLSLLQSGPILIGLDEFLDKHNFDVIHCSPFPLYINKQVINYIKRSKKKSKLIITPFFHSQSKIFGNPELQELFESADMIHVISEVEKEEINTAFKVDKKKIQAIPLFLDIKKMHPLKILHTETNRFRVTHNLIGKKIILFAGIKGASKGAVDLLKAVDELYKADKNFVLIAIGSSTPEWNDAKREVNKNFLLDLGYRQGREKEVIFASADIFCMPSKTETFGLVYLEAWHKKKPTIAADIPAVRELIGDAGLLVSYGSIQAISEAIKNLSYNDKLIEKLGEKGYNKLISEFDFSQVFQLYNNLFKSLLVREGKLV